LSSRSEPKDLVEHSNCFLHPGFPQHISPNKLSDRSTYLRLSFSISISSQTLFFLFFGIPKRFVLWNADSGTTIHAFSQVVTTKTSKMAAVLGRASRTFLILAAVVLCVGRYLQRTSQEQLRLALKRNNDQEKKFTNKAKTKAKANSKQTTPVSTSISDISRVSAPGISAPVFAADAPVPCNLGAAYPIANATMACAIFYPARFFAAASAAASASDDSVQFYESSYSGNRPVFDIEGTPVIHLERNNNIQPEHTVGVPKSITYLHNRKVGGSTMHAAFRLNKKNYNGSGSLALHVTLSWKMRNEMGMAAYHEAWNSKLSEIVASQRHNNATASETASSSSSSPAAVVFTFVRCPVQRFLSAVGQLLSARHRFERHFGSCDLDPNENPTIATTTATATATSSDSAMESLHHTMDDTRRLLQCTLDILEKSVQENGPSSFLDVHLEPQVYQMRKSVNSVDVGILILDLSHISSVLSILRPRSANLHKRSSTSTKYTGGHDLSSTGTAGGADGAGVLLSDELVQQICRIYAVDVQMLQLTSVSPTLCV
jgi:hypothetical protein